jgi:hypothetical protein
MIQKNTTNLQQSKLRKQGYFFLTLVVRRALALILWKKEVYLRCRDSS